jgi:hypothetical protein
MAIDIKLAAQNIISDHTAAFMSGTTYVPTKPEELYDTMLNSCAHLLTEDFLNGVYTPMEYNDIRNELGSILWNAFHKCDD